MVRAACQCGRVCTKMKHDSGSLSFHRRPCKASMSLLVSSSRVGKVGCLRGVVGGRRRILVLQYIIRTFPVLFIQLIFVWGAAGAKIRTTNQFHFNAAKSCSKSMEHASPRHVVVSKILSCRQRGRQHVAESAPIPNKSEKTLVQVLYLPAISPGHPK